MRSETEKLLLRVAEATEVYHLFKISWWDLDTCSWRERMYGRATIMDGLRNCLCEHFSALTIEYLS